VDNKVDYYALSFVKDAEVVHELKDFLKGLVFLHVTSEFFYIIGLCLERDSAQVCKIKLLKCCRSWS
jgi:hypothetical protein